MSADNGIYILSGPKSFKISDLEYRVIHITNIEDIYHGKPEEEEFNPEKLVEFFGQAKVVDSEEAFKIAKEMYDVEVLTGCPVEYGISEIRSTKPFSYFLHYTLRDE